MPRGKQVTDPLQAKQDWHDGYAHGYGMATQRFRTLLESGAKRSEVVAKLAKMEENAKLLAKRAPGSVVESDSVVAEPSGDPAVHGGPGDPVYPTAKRSWAEEFTAARTMAPLDSREYLRTLIAGRSLPDGFKEWLEQRKVQWLNMNWPL